VVILVEEAAEVVVATSRPRTPARGRIRPRGKIKVKTRAKVRARVKTKAKIRRRRVPRASARWSSSATLPIR
jgi:hypothetical protein